MGVKQPTAFSPFRLLGRFLSCQSPLFSPWSQLFSELSMESCLLQKGRWGRMWQCEWGSPYHFLIEGCDFLVFLVNKNVLCCLIIFHSNSHSFNEDYFALFEIVLRHWGWTVLPIRKRASRYAMLFGEVFSA